MSFMIPNSTAVILFPGIHKQGNSAGWIILLIKASIHTETPWRRTRLPRGEQLFCHQRELKSCPLVTRVPTAGCSYRLTPWVLPSTEAHRAEKAALHLSSHPLSFPMGWSYFCALGSCICFLEPLSTVSALLRIPNFFHHCHGNSSWLFKEPFLWHICLRLWQNTKVRDISEMRMQTLAPTAGMYPLPPVSLLFTARHWALQEAHLTTSSALSSQPSHSILCTFSSLCCFTVTQWQHPSPKWAMSIYPFCISSTRTQ